MGMFSKIILDERIEYKNLMKEKVFLQFYLQEWFGYWENQWNRKRKDVLEDWQENCHVKGVNDEGIKFFIPKQGGTTCQSLFYKFTSLFERMGTFFIFN